MAEAYKQRQAEITAKVKQDRQQRLAKLEAQKERSLMLSKEQSLTLSDREEDIMDDEYRTLLEKYGDRLRMPRIPPLAWKQRSVMSSESARSQKPQIPKQRQRAMPTAIKAGITARTGNPGGGTDKKKASIAIVPPGASAALPALKTGKPSAPVSPTAAEAAAAPADAEDEIPEWQRSVMPRKEALRKFQQSLIKNTEVSFYKSHMKKHLRRILEATETTFSRHGR